MSKNLKLQVERRPACNPDGPAMYDPVTVRARAGALDIRFTTGGDIRGTSYSIPVSTADLAALMAIIGEAIAKQEAKRVELVSELHYRKLSPAGREIMDRGN